ncbi:MAG: hypothetical protein WA830_17745 [Candidatus Sulfotelmatobacter sp.]
MKTAIQAIIFTLLLALPAFAGGVRIINATCEAAITKAEVLAAQRKWWPDRPDPKAPVLSIRTHGNFAKQVILPLGSVWSHEKVGELAFEELDQSCRVISNGHPADVVLSDLAKAEFTAPPRPTEAGLVPAAKGKKANGKTVPSADQGWIDPADARATTWWNPKAEPKK